MKEIRPAALPTRSASPWSPQPLDTLLLAGLGMYSITGTIFVFASITDFISYGRLARLEEPISAKYKQAYAQQLSQVNCQTEIRF
jgi:hypothetical protein